MAQIKIKRTEEPLGSRTLEYGELAIAEDKLYFGNSNNMPVAVGAAAEMPTIMFSKMYCNNTSGYWDATSSSIFLVFEYSGDLRVGDELTICRRKLSIEKKNRTRKRYRLGVIISFTLTQYDLYTKDGKKFVKVELPYDALLANLLYRTDTLEPAMRIKYVRIRRKIVKSNSKHVSSLFSNIVPLVWTTSNEAGGGRVKVMVKPL